MNHHAKFDAISFILGREISNSTSTIRNHTNTQKKTNKQIVTDISTSCLSAFVNKKLRYHTKQIHTYNCGENLVEGQQLFVQKSAGNLLQLVKHNTLQNHCYHLMHTTNVVTLKRCSRLPQCRHVANCRNIRLVFRRIVTVAFLRRVQIFLLTYLLTLILAYLVHYL